VVWGQESGCSFRSRIGSAQPTAGQPKAGKPEAARVGREGGATVSVRSRGVLPRRGQETPSSKLLAANRTEGRQRADGQGSNRGVRRIWLHKCTGPRKRRDTEKTPAKPVSAAAEPPLGGQYIPLCLCGGWWRVERSDMPDPSHIGVRAYVATAQVKECEGGVEHEAGRPGGRAGAHQPDTSRWASMKWRVAPLRGVAALGGNGHARMGASRGGRPMHRIGQMNAFG
jgi:hypothetical protein